MNKNKSSDYFSAITDGKLKLEIFLFNIDDMPKISRGTKLELIGIIEKHKGII